MDLERFSGSTGISWRAEPGDDLPDRQHGHLTGQRMGAAHGCRFSVHGATDCGLLLVAAVFYPRDAGRRCQRVSDYFQCGLVYCIVRIYCPGAEHLLA